MPIVIPAATQRQDVVWPSDYTADDSPLSEGEFDLDGYRFGTLDYPVVILDDGLDTGAAEPTVQDADNPVGDGGYFGRDFLRGPTWAFSLGVRDDADVYTVLGQLAHVWRNEAVRTDPGAVSTLRFMRNGKVWRVYGRPRRWGVSPSGHAEGTWAVVEADFKVDGIVQYADEAAMLDLQFRDPLSGGGLRLPAAPPWPLAMPSGTRQGLVTVASVEPAPFEVDLFGPVTGSLTNPKLTGDGWELALATSIAYDESVHIDTRAMTATKGGKSVAGTLSRRSRLNARLTPGVSEVTFTGLDPSNTARARFTWRAVSPIL